MNFLQPSLQNYPAYQPLQVSNWPGMFPPLLMPNTPVYTTAFTQMQPIMVPQQPIGTTAIGMFEPVMTNIEPAPAKKLHQEHYQLQKQPQEQTQSSVKIIGQNSTSTDEMDSVSPKVFSISSTACLYTKQQTPKYSSAGGASITSLEKFDPVVIPYEQTGAKKNLKYISKVAVNRESMNQQCAASSDKLSLNNNNNNNNSSSNLNGKRNNEDPYQNYEYISQIKNQLRKQVLKCFFKHAAQYMPTVQQQMESKNPDFSMTDLKALCGFWSQFDNPTKRQHLKNEQYSQLCKQLNFNQDVKPLGQKYLTQIFCQPTPMSNALRDLYALFNSDAKIFASRQKKAVMKKYYVETSNQINQDILTSTLSRTRI